MRGDGLAAIANVVNWRFIFAGRSYADLFAVPSPLTHYWSLSVEEQFYLVLAPTLATAAWRCGAARACRLTIGIVGLGAAVIRRGLAAASITPDSTARTTEPTRVRSSSSSGALLAVR